MALPQQREPQFQDGATCGWGQSQPFWVKEFTSGNTLGEILKQPASNASRCLGKKGHVFMSPLTARLLLKGVVLLHHFLLRPPWIEMRSQPLEPARPLGSTESCQRILIKEGPVLCFKTREIPGPTHMSPMSLVQS